MDPLENLCIIQDSFVPHQPNPSVAKYSESFVGSPRARRNKVISTSPTEYATLKIPEVDKSIEISGFFKNHSSYVLANIDSIYNFTRQENGYLVYQVINENFKYCVLDDNGFLEYLQYRLPESIGFTNCKVETKFPKIKINTNCDDGIIKYVRDISSEGVDLVVSNRNDLIENSKKALQMLKKDGVFITKISDIDLSALYILTLSFSTFSLFRPFLANENVMYVIGENFNGNPIDILPLFSSQISVPQSFYDYVDSQLISPSTNHIYNLYRCKALMNVE
jgi:hypothetical protein